LAVLVVLNRAFHRDHSIKLLVKMKEPIIRLSGMLEIRFCAIMCRQKNGKNCIRCEEKCTALIIRKGV
jgi:hypothetical protein